MLEIMADPEFPGLEREILSRVCAEAIENDRQEIVYESSAADPLHAAVAGGDGRVAKGDRMIVGRVFQPQVLLEALARRRWPSGWSRPAFGRRWNSASTPHPSAAR